MRRGIGIAVVAAVAVLAGCTAAPPSNEESAVPQIVPQPVSLKTTDAAPFELVARSRLVASGDGAAAVAEQVAGWFRVSTGFPLDVVEADAASASGDDVVLAVAPGSAPAGHEQEGYTLAVSGEGAGARISADTAEGLFRGAQTLRQLFDPLIDSRAQVEQRWRAPAVAIEDYPRFAYRGASLDVARHFFGVDDVERYLDDIALAKVNHLHLHLTDDQGWRIQIESWPNLTAAGSATEVGGGTGGFYTQADYARIVAYAAERFITIVPEIDLPGHTNAALASYPELNCDGVAPEPYTGTEVGFSSLCIDKPITYRFVADVVRELAAITPGPYLHLGGDESLSTPREDFVRFLERVTREAADATGKTIIGWHEMGAATGLPRGTIGQYWGYVHPQVGFAEETLSFVRSGGSIIMSPADVAYLDMVYDDDTRWGLSWANGATPVSESSDWDPAEIIDGIGDAQLLGVEAPIWTETLTSMDQVEFMAFPRLANIAEIGWSARSDRDWQRVAPRLVAFCARLTALGIGFYRSPDMPWSR
ncbi:beta-N-acetylhexosaminidase [Rathayibacter sp. YIM 133350]|uniref:beta-N-acetylhexosaminidase n=1 Tax=Rathayibacter sp. YIM 133350 TaxID=3131992 RepID=UPI00307D9D3C